MDVFPNAIGAQTYTVAAWRLTLNQNSSTTLEALTDNFTANNTTVHPILVPSRSTLPAGC